MEPKDLSLKSTKANNHFYSNKPDATTEYLAGARVKREFRHHPEPRDVTNIDRWVGFFFQKDLILMMMMMFQNESVLKIVTINRF